MSRRANTLPPDYFAALYAADPDPWRFATSDYEREKYTATLGALPRDRYGAALEVGCSIGVLTRELGGRCDDLLALDVVPAVLEAARARCADQPHVRFRQAAIPAAWPEGTFDLILLSEVAYYLDRADLSRLVARVGDSLAAGGDCVLVHWIGETNYPLSGDEAATAFIAEAAGFAAVTSAARATAYRLDVLRRVA